MSTQSQGLLRAYALDGKGGGRALGWVEIEAWKAGDGPIWIHLDRNHAGARQWIEERAGLDATVAESLLVEGSRPRTELFDSGLLVFMRGINHNPGSEPEDMLALRMWVEDERLVSLRVDQLVTTGEIGKRIEGGHGPRTIPDLLVRIARELVDRVGPVIDAAEEQVADVEERSVEDRSTQLRGELAEIRR